MSRNYLFNVDYVSKIHDFDSLVKIQNDIKQYLQYENEDWIFIFPYISPFNSSLRANFFEMYTKKPLSILENLFDSSLLMKLFPNYKDIELELRVYIKDEKKGKENEMSYVDYLPLSLLLIQQRLLLTQ